MNTPNGEVVKVKSSSNVQKVAGCIAGCVEKGVRDWRGSSQSGCEERRCGERVSFAEGD